MFILRLYDFYPEGKQDLLIDTMKMLKYTGDPWEDVFKEEVCFYYHQAGMQWSNRSTVFPKECRGELDQSLPRVNLARCQYG